MVNKKTSKNSANSTRIGEGKPGPGRPPGAVNKVTATVKMLTLDALDALGGKKWLVKLGKTHPQVFAQLLAKIMPTQVVGDVSHRFVAELPPPEQDAEEWLRKYSPKQTHQAPATKQ